MTTEKKHPPAKWLTSPPFYEYVGLELDELADGRSVVRMPFRKHLGNSRGEVHGGALATLMDAAMSQAVRSKAEPGVASATISMTLNYFAPAHGEVRCTGAIVRGGRSVVFAEAEVTDERGTLACRATATFRVMPRKEG